MPIVVMTGKGYNRMPVQPIDDIFVALNELNAHIGPGEH
jgi:hypothetical protein